MLSRNLTVGRLMLRSQFSRSAYHSSAIVQEGAEEMAPKVDKERLKIAARDYNNRRAAYRKQVSQIRKEYAEQVAQQRAADLAEQEAQQKAATRRRLERQRLKNIRSAQNALRQEEMRKQREKEFNEHLVKMQAKRDLQHEQYTKARQKLVDELEKVAPLWLTTPEEVENAFTSEAEQLLWTFPGGILGEPSPSLDAHFWQHETHTWQMNRTYKSRREALLEKLQEMAYNEANIDPTFWTEERLNERKQMQDKARLRAMVKMAGERSLLWKQRLMMEELSATKEDGIPQPIRAPSNLLLRNDSAKEAEGYRLLLENPTKFFVFDEDKDDYSRRAEDQENYTGPTLGSPIGLRDPLREDSNDGQVFPEVVGKFIKPDMRTEREKKQQEREERMLAAAQAEAHSGDLSIELAAEQQVAEDLEPDLDYDNNEWDSDDEEWKKGLDPIIDHKILETPRQNRFSEDDIDWVLAQLDGKIMHFEQQLKQDIEDMKRRIRTELTTSAPDTSGSIKGLEESLLSLSEEQLMLLSDLDEQYEGLSPDEYKERVKAIGLPEEQIASILGRDRDE
ncbi:hypothetical protein FisN_1Hh546 [Fistulifera solaris]|uniref:Uncharacterized protein n=1 Tax=Fistulifera solaris TaxID=1519565 RepID=A0A1Z5JKB3_FISSO|nr:hypothetical protein FisN_1Hh546 [Fistulifera solaris]|eukprot:GAX14346.1 hypothetical protein FisN_1Hh546 [Fistulifera solaris]